MNKKTIRDVDVTGKRCLVRVDFNVPIQNGVITDLNRLNGALPTIEYLASHGAKVILCSHLGKPHAIFTEGFALDKKEKQAIAALPAEEQAAAKEAAVKKALKNDAVKYSLKPVADKLAEMVSYKVTFAADIVGPDATAKAAALKDGEILLLENTRFDAGEEGRDLEFCKKLAAFADIFVNDAFGTAHRSHASTAAIVEYGLVKTAVCGFLIEQELKVMAGALDHPVRPFVAILGGAKISDKLLVISNLLEKCDSLIIGGGMAFTFIKALGHSVGTSLVDNDKLGYCKEMLDKAAALGKRIYLPVDAMVASSFPNPIDAAIDVEASDINAIPDSKMGLDIGPASVKIFTDVINSAKTVIWNGPMGVFENPVLANGTASIAKALAETIGTTTIIGGGDSAAAVAQLGYADKMTHISTGGGASLELFEGKILPGIDCLNDAE